MNETPAWLTVTEAAARLQVSEKTIRKRIARGALQAEKIPLPGGGNAWRINPDSTGPTLLTTTQAAAAMGVSERTVQRRCRKGTLPARLVEGQTGAQWMVESATLDESEEEPAPADLVAELRAEVAFLRVQLEERNRAETELLAILLQLTKATP